MKSFKGVVILLILLTSNVCIGQEGGSLWQLPSKEVQDSIRRQLESGSYAEANNESFGFFNWLFGTSKEETSETGAIDYFDPKNLRGEGVVTVEKSDEQKLQEAASKYESDLSNTMKMYGHEVLESSSFRLSADNPVSVLEFSEGNRLIMQLLIPEESPFVNEPIGVSILVTKSISPDGYRFLTPGYQIEVNKPLLGRMIRFTLTNPVIENIVLQVFDQLSPQDREASERVNSSSVMWGEEWPNTTSNVSIMEESYGMRLPDTVVDRGLSIIPTYYDFVNKGFALTAGLPDVPNIEVSGDKGDMAYAKAGPLGTMVVVQRGKPLVREPTREPEALSTDCRYIWYDGRGPTASKYQKNIAPSPQSYRNHPLYQVCGLDELIREFNNPADYDIMMLILNEELVNMWKYLRGETVLTGNELFEASDVFEYRNFKDNITSITFTDASNIGNDISNVEWGSNNPSNFVSVYLSIQKFIELYRAGASRSGVDSKDMICAGLAFPISDAFIHENMLNKTGTAKTLMWNTYGIGRDGLIAYMVERMCDRSPNMWMKLLGGILNSRVNMYGISPFWVSKDYPYRDMRKPYYDNPGGSVFMFYLNSYYTDAGGDAGGLIADVIEGKIYDLHKTISKEGRALLLDPVASQAALNKIKGEEIVRAVTNVKMCKMEGPSLISKYYELQGQSPSELYVGADSKRYDATDKKEDIFGRKLLEVGTVARDQGNMYNWLNCDELKSGYGAYFVKDYIASPNYKETITFDIQSYYVLNQLTVSGSQFSTSVDIQDGGVFPINSILIMEPMLNGRVLPYTRYPIKEGTVSDVNFNTPIGMMMLPINGGVMEATFQLKDVRVSDGDNEINFYFYSGKGGFDDKSLSQIYLTMMTKSNVPYFRQVAIGDLPTVEENLVDVDNKNGVLRVTPFASRVAKIYIPPKRTDKGEGYGLPDQIIFTLVNSNSYGMYKNSPLGMKIKCEPSTISAGSGISLGCGVKKNTCKDYGMIPLPISVSTAMGRQCACECEAGGENLLTPIMVRIALEPASNCPEGLMKTRDGDCGCPSNDGVFGIGCKEDGFKAHSYTDADGKKVCGCVPKCVGNEKWNAATKKCEPCPVGEYNAYFEPEGGGLNKGAISECRACPSNSILSFMDKFTGKDCSKPYEECIAQCGCNANLTWTKDENGKPICAASCDLGYKWNSGSAKCEPCRFWETSSPDRLSCVSCSPRDALPGGSNLTDLQRLSSCSNCDETIIFFESPEPRGCDHFINRCVKKGTDYDNRWHYNFMTRRCEICPANKQFEPNDASICRDCPKNSIYTSLGCRCPSGMLSNYNTWSCECPPGAIFSAGACACPSGGIWKAVANNWGKMCECPSGSKLSSDGLRCETTCESGKILISGTCYWEAGVEACTVSYPVAYPNLMYEGYFNKECNLKTAAWSMVEKVNYDAAQYDKFYCPSGYPYVKPEGHVGCCLKHYAAIDYVTGVNYNNNTLDLCCPSGMNPVAKSGYSVCE